MRASRLSNSAGARTWDAGRVKKSSRRQVSWGDPWRLADWRHQWAPYHRRPDSRHTNTQCSVSHWQLLTHSLNGKTSYKKERKKEKWTHDWTLHFTPLACQPCGADFYHFWHVGSHRRHNFSSIDWGLGGYGCPKSWVLHWLWSSPLQQCFTHYRATLWSNTLSRKRLSAGPGFNPQTRQNKLFHDYWRACFEINFSDMQEGLTVSSIICDR